MEYRIESAFNLKNKTVLALDQPRRVQDLGCTEASVDGVHLKVDYIHPDEAVVIEQVENPEEIIGKKIIFAR